LNYGQMELNIKGIIFKERRKEMVYSNGLMDLTMKENS